MKTLLLKVIRRRSPVFHFDAEISIPMLLQFIFVQSTALIRAWKLFLVFKNPKGLSLGKGVQFFNMRRISWGRYVRIGDQVYISALGKHGITIGNNVKIGAFSRIVLSVTMNLLGESIKIGDNAAIGEFAYLGGAGGLEIGEDCIIGQYLSCHPENHNYADPTLPYRFQGVTRKGIKIGRNCWFGSKVTILDGVEIGDSCVIAAGSVVTKSMPPNSLIAGVPAKVLKPIEGGVGVQTLKLTF